MDPVHVLRTADHVLVSLTVLCICSNTSIEKQGLGLGARGRSDRGADAVFELYLATCTCGAILGAGQLCETHRAGNTTQGSIGRRISYMN